MLLEATSCLFPFNRESCEKEQYDVLSFSIHASDNAIAKDSLLRTLSES
jgi:hypothetical protein